ncbi:MAG: DUF4124 domain-containing protein [candidate division KSB1 bacterium]|nr:DUF4124 domain-containing protein [candidate division KSB1 bacterium]
MWRVWLVLLLSLGTQVVHADVYRCPDGSGGTRYQNVPCSGDDTQPILKTEAPASPPAPHPRSASPRRGPAAKSLQEEREARQQAQRNALRFVRVEEIRELTGPTRLVLRGKVRNDSRQRVDLVRLYVEWQDSTGKVLDTRALRIGPLGPGQARSWSASARREAQHMQYRVYIAHD